jgi:hypothetical protein
LTINIAAKPGTTPEMIVAEIKRLEASTYWRGLTRPRGELVEEARRRAMWRHASLRRAAERRARVKARRQWNGWPT